MSGRTLFDPGEISRKLTDLGWTDAQNRHVTGKINRAVGEPQDGPDVSAEELAAAPTQDDAALRWLRNATYSDPTAEYVRRKGAPPGALPVAPRVVSISPRPKDVPTDLQKAWLAGLGMLYEKGEPPGGRENYGGWRADRGKAPPQWPATLEGTQGMAKPAKISGGAPDYTDRYNTKLSSLEEAAYQKWAKENKRDRDVFDYDMRGAWKAGIGASENGHFPDTYKKPNHPTFSNESRYHGADGEAGGSWDGEVFTPGPTNDKYWPGTALEEYISRYGDGASLRRR